MVERAETKWITSNDLERSATAHMLEDVLGALRPVGAAKYSRMLDIGCGYGGLPRLISEHLDISEVHGIDIDAEVLKEAREKGILTHYLDVNETPLPFPDGFFDLIVSFGMLDYLPFFDHFIREIFRVARPGGHTLISLPNLASWHNRLFLLLGYQPRDIEVSREFLAGVHPWYRENAGQPTGHIHSVTVPTFRELMAYHGFQTVRVTGGRPRSGRKMNLVVALADALFCKKATLARRFFYLGVKPNEH